MRVDQEDICSKLQRVILKQLTPLIDSDYCYLDLPYHSNIGDSLIWLGTDYFLKTLPYNCQGQHSIETFDFHPLPPDTIILLHGGGNFGDIWRQHQEFRLKVIQTYPDNPIIVLPQTVYYESQEVFTEDVRKMNQHHKLTICARDSHSAELLTQKGFTGQTLTLPDMAFCIDRDIIWGYKNRVTKETLLLLRKDKESPKGSLTKGVISTQTEIKDWPTQKEAYKIAKRNVRKHTTCEIDTFFQTSFLPERIKEGVKFVSEYKMVYSTRLHVAILRLLLGMPVKMMDNSYGKNLNFYDTWLKDSNLVSTPDEEELEAIDMAIYTHHREHRIKKRRQKICIIILTLILLVALTALIASLTIK